MHRQPYCHAYVCTVHIIVLMSMLILVVSHADHCNHMLLYIWLLLKVYDLCTLSHEFSAMFL